jgi:hypothetical protein
MLAPSEPISKPPQPKPLRQSLQGAAVVIGATAFGAVVLYLVTEALFLIVHQVL